MKGKILVTDSLFIFDEHVKQLEDAGYEIERLDKPRATEEELCQALKGKVGYILGGIEQVTDKVIDAADELKAIAFTGSDWRAIIPGWQRALEKGVKIANAPGANAFAVAEFSVAVALAMQRNLFELGRTGDKKFETTKSFKDSIVGVLGAGHIGSKIVIFSRVFQPAKILYFSRSEKDGVEAEYSDLDSLLSQSDIIFMALPGAVGTLFNKEKLHLIKRGSLLVSISPMNVIDFDALLPLLKEGRLRATTDWPIPIQGYKDLPLSTWFNTNDHAAYNTYEAAQKGSDMSTQSLLNLLETGQDQYMVNP
jgi:phosphoglycerate dehydrogenase-like enzyme